jgi:hypothetical protein
MRCIHSTFVESAGSQIVEFAVSLPLLLVFAVGIFDFGTVFNIKQKLISASFEGARIASNQPTNDLSNSIGSCGAPVSICTVRDGVDNVLLAGKVNDCGLLSASAPPSTSRSWVFTANTNCAGTLVLTIDRASTYAADTYSVEASKVTLAYPYQWTFNRVIQLLVSGANYPANSQLTTLAVMQNLS